MENYKGIEEFYNVYIKLEEIKRAGWVKRKLPEDKIETVSGHTLQVVMLANVLCHELGLNHDLTRLAEMCFIHDIGEAIIGDSAEIDKDYAEIKKQEEMAVLDVLSTLSIKLVGYYYKLWKEFEEKSTPLGKFCYEVDKLSAVMRAKTYSNELDRPEIFESFYDYEVNRKTFDNSDLKGMFESLNPNNKRKEIKS